MTLTEILGDQLINHKGENISVSDLASKKIVGVYFSAHWCPPCRFFTPVLIETYQKLVKNGESIEIVFVSSDKDQNAFKEYYGSMPWLAVDYQDRERKQKLAEMFGVRGIPTFVILDGSGNLLTKDGRTVVAQDTSGDALMKL